MSPNNNNLKPIINSNKADINPEPIGDKSTLGLHDSELDDYGVWCSWAEELGYLNTLNLLTDVFNINAIEVKELPYINIFNLLSSDSSLKILKSCSSENTEYKYVYELVLAAKRDSQAHCGPFKNKAPSSMEPKIKLDRDPFYLLRLFISDEKIQDNLEYDDINILITWVLMHAIDRFMKGIMFDELLRDVSSYIRSLLEKDTVDVLELMNGELSILRAGKEINDFDKLNLYFRGRIEAANNLTRGVQTFVNKVRKISLFQPSKYPTDSATPTYLLTGVKHFGDLNIREDESDFLPLVANYKNDDNEFTKINVDAEASYTYQKLSAKSVFLTNIEHLQNFQWSWDRLTEHETNELSKWINSCWKGNSDSVLGLLATITWISLHTGRSLMRTLDMDINEEIGKEWTFNMERCSLMRMSPKRQNSWEPKTEEKSAWIEGMAAYNEIKLPDEAKDSFKKLSDNLGDTKTLGEYWIRLSPSEKIISVFTKEMTGEKSRIKSGMLSLSLSQNCFDKTNDKVLSQMIGYHPQSGLTGAFAYGSWTTKKIKEVTNNIHRSLDENMKDVPDNICSFGSRVNPKESLINQEIIRSHEYINKIDRYANPIDFHNNYVSYLMMMLWAGTGVRPIKDSFESHLHFNYEYGFVFVNDKACDKRRMGRLVPLPEKLVTLLKTKYIQHLEILKKSLLESNAELSSEISALISNKPTGNIPFFFHLDPISLDWRSVSEKSIISQELFHWPLKYNLFRQRLAKLLPKLGVDSEVVSTWLGHKDAGIDVYGNYSVRCYLDDLEREKEKINEAFARLEFREIATWVGTPNIKPVKKSVFNAKLYGIARREEKRSKDYKEVKKQTKVEVDEFIDNRDIAKINQEEIEYFEKKLMLKIGGVPRLYAVMRLGIFHEMLDGYNEGVLVSDDVPSECSLKKFKITRRYIKFDDDFNGVESTAPEYLSIYKELKCLFFLEFKKIQASKLSVTNSKLLSVLALMFENRISYKRLLMDVSEGHNYRLIKYQGRYYIEYGEDLVKEDVFTPMERHRVSLKSATLLNNLLGSKMKEDGDHPLINKLLKILNKYRGDKITLEKGSDDFITVCSEILKSANSIQLPGVVSSYLSGEVTSTSLNWVDMVRLTQGDILNVDIILNNVEPKNIVNSMLLRETFKHNSSVVASLDGELLEKNANNLMKAVRLIINEYYDVTEDAVKSTVKKLQELINDHSNLVSPSIILVVRWIRHTIRKGKIKNQDSNKDEYYSKNTIWTYFSSFTSTFVTLAYNKDMLNMESEEITELYNDFLTSIELKVEYKGARLEGFHKYCHKENVDNPDWNELNISKKKQMSLAGVVTEKDYYNVLNLILSDAEMSDIDKRQMAFLLLLCFRFGLRSMEAVGLRRCDWVEYNDLENIKQTYILISEHKGRKLKTVGSRRIVPLMFKLNKDEVDLIDDVIAMYDTQNSGTNNRSLFSLPDENVNKKITSIRRALINILKHITGNVKMVNHHLRHSFANNTSMAIYNLEFEPWDKMMENEGCKHIIRTTALGEHINIAARNSMCSARLMGHTYPGTQAISYHHYYDEWANILANVCDKQTKITLSKAIVLEDVYSFSSSVDTRLANKFIPTYKPTTIANLLRMLSLVSNGKTFDMAGRRMFLDPSHVEFIQELIESVDLKNKISKPVKPKRRRKKAKTKSKPKIINNHMLEHIPRSAWKSLIELASSLESKELNTISNSIDSNVIGSMIGKTRQLVLIDEPSFIMAKYLLEFFNIDTGLLSIASSEKTTELVGLCGKYDFDSLSDRKGVEIDMWKSIQDSKFKTDVTVNIVFKENNKCKIKNSYQFSVCLIVLFVTLYFDQR